MYHLFCTIGLQCTAQHVLLQNSTCTWLALGKGSSHKKQDIKVQKTKNKTPTKGGCFTPAKVTHSV